MIEYFSQSGADYSIGPVKKGGSNEKKFFNDFIIQIIFEQKASTMLQNVNIELSLILFLTKSTTQT